MKILFVYPQYPDTFWSFKHALKLVSKKAAFPPLGLLTVAAMLPADWEKRLVDLNVTPLIDADIRWADYVFVSAMVVQKESAKEVFERCRKLGAKVVAGGPLFTTGHDEFEGVDHFVLGEAEATLAPFLKDLAEGRAKHIYTSGERPDISQTPVPLWSLLKMKNYTSMSLQYSRGCPFDCEFCDIVVLNGHMPRTKTRAQVTAELDAIYEAGWRGSVFVVDDNFIGNKKKLKQETLPAIIEWMREKGQPFGFFTEASINLADDEELMDLMVEAGFSKVFVGIETPVAESLAECNKMQNKGRDLVASVKRIQNHCLEVMGGFIVGFDSDPLSIFKSQINFIQKSGIVTAMVGLLHAPRGTRLYQRLKGENRIVNSFTGDNMDCALNFLPKMDRETLINGYQQILHTIYSPKQFYERIKIFLKEYRPPKRSAPIHVHAYHIRGALRTIWTLGFQDKGRWYWWRLIFAGLLKYPRSLPMSVGLAIYGFHFRKVAEKYIKTHARAPEHAA
ncbi:MAG: B12-binding domain-containing radical SAM protein [Chloroflexi bacterium]|nr:B12-binding domain-containing radical SAM protein [Chloroflexota bacterium]